MYRGPSSFWGNSDEVVLAHRSDLQSGWGWFLAFGILLALIGMFAFVESFVATTALILILGGCFVAAGIVHLFQSFFSRRPGLILTQLALAAVYGVVGVLIILQPIAVALSMTLLLALFFLIEGGIDLVASAQASHPNRGWNAVSGLVAIGLGILIFMQWPVSGLWVIGLFVGLNLMINGFQMVSLALALRPHTAAGPRRVNIGSKPLHQG